MCIKSNLILLTLIFLSSAVSSQTIKVTAEYKPASYESSGGQFISTTPCLKTSEGIWFSVCKGNISSLDSLLFSIRQTVSRSVKENIKQPKDSFVFLSSAGQKTITVTSTTGASYPVEFIPEQLGVHFDSVVSQSVGWPIYNNAFANPVGGCTFIDRQMAGGTNLNVWMVLWGNIAAKSCYTSLSVDGLAKIHAFFLGFKIKPPSPLNMPNGIYKGLITLSVSESGDISLGNGTYSDNQLNVDLTLTVRHQLKVEFSKGEGEGRNKISLLPHGGWINWIHSGKREPNLLQQDLPFRIWFSAPFTVALRCQYQWSASGECALKDSKGRTVPLKTYYVNRLNETTLLTTNKSKFVPPVQGSPVINAARAIRFQIVGGTVSEMMKYPGSNFKGDVTLIFDAAID